MKKVYKDGQKLIEQEDANTQMLRMVLLRARIELAHASLLIGQPRALPRREVILLIDKMLKEER